MLCFAGIPCARFFQSFLRIVLCLILNFVPPRRWSNSQRQVNFRGYQCRCPSWTWIWRTKGKPPQKNCEICKLLEELPAARRHKIVFTLGALSIFFFLKKVPKILSRPILQKTGRTLFSISAFFVSPQFFLGGFCFAVFLCAVVLKFFSESCFA